MSPTVLRKTNLYLVSDKVEELGRPSVVGIASSFLLRKRSLGVGGERLIEYMRHDSEMGGTRGTIAVGSDRGEGRR